jgi:hypothetical protein
LFEIFYRAETGLSVCHCCVHEMLFSVFVDGETFEGEVAGGTEGWTHVSWAIDWTLEASGLHSSFDEVEFNSDDAGLIC